MELTHNDILDLELQAANGFDAETAQAIMVWVKAQHAELVEDTAECSGCGVTFQKDQCGQCAELARLNLPGKQQEDESDDSPPHVNPWNGKTTVIAALRS